jgi:hypothetical protein
MAWIVGDSFDYYGNAADIARSVWDSATIFGSLNGTATVTRFGTGQCLTNFGNLVLQKTLASNETTLFLAIAYYHPGALSGTTAETYWQLRDGATAQCTVCFESGGNITLKSGTQSGTVLATYGSAFAQDVWTHFQVKVVINNTTGSITVRKNGSATDSFTATALNTRGGTANNYANVVTINGGTSNVPYMDDVLIYSGTAPAPNDWIGDTRAVCLMPKLDTAQKNFAQFPVANTTVLGHTAAAINLALAANTIVWTGSALVSSATYVPVRGGQIVKVTMTSTQAVGSGHFRAAVYANDGPSNQPGTLVGISNELTSLPGGNALVDFTFPAGSGLAPGRGYYIALLADTACGFGVGSPTAGEASYTSPVSYASGFPSTAPTTPTTVTGNYIQGQITLSGNSSCVSELLANGDTDYVFSATVNDADLYDMAELTYVPAAIIGVVSKMYCKKSDAGARNGQLLVKSGATQVTGPDTPLSSSYTYLARVDTVDPNTGATWTAAGIAAAQVGQKVTA